MVGRYSDDEAGEIARLRDEAEQLRTALEHADEEIAKLADHRDRLVARLSDQGHEFAVLKAAYEQAEKTVKADAAERAQWEAARNQDEEELRVAFEELQVVTEELENANASLRSANEELDARVQERTRAIAQSEERLRAAAEVGRLGLWDWNLETGEIHWSDEHFRMSGYAVGEVAPTYEAWATRIHPDDRPRTEAALAEARQSGQEYVHEFRTVHPGGSVHWLYARGRFFHDAQGAAVRMIGAMLDTTERREWEERQTVLVGELQHRTRNLIGMVRSMADKVVRSSTDLDDFRMRFRDRLDALSRVQGLLSRLNEHDRVTFDQLIHTELAAMAGNSERVSLDGPPGVRLRSSTVQILAMGLHELATNAVKYGALGQPQASLHVNWRVEPHEPGGKPWLHIDWRETGVEMSQAPDAAQDNGQGRELIERALPYQLSARTTFALEPDGVQCTISLPVSESVDAGAPGNG